MKVASLKLTLTLTLTLSLNPKLTLTLTKTLTLTSSLNPIPKPYTNPIPQITRFKVFSVFYICSRPPTFLYHITQHNNNITHLLSTKTLLINKRINFSTFSAVFLNSVEDLKLKSSLFKFHQQRVRHRVRKWSAHKHRYLVTRCRFSYTKSIISRRQQVVEAFLI